MKRFCFVILEGQSDENGYIPSAVIEGEKGHNPMAGNGDFSSPWYWGKTFDEAQKVCADFNLKQLGISKEEAAKIVLSTM